MLGSPCTVHALSWYCAHPDPSGVCLLPGDGGTGICTIPGCAGGCPGGAACVDVGLGAPLCLTACSNEGETGQCGRGAGCARVVTEQVCRPLFQSPCQPGESCANGRCVADVLPDGFGRCALECVTWLNDCPGGQSCYPHTGFNGLCSPAGGVQEGGPCRVMHDCAPSLACIPADGGGWCERTCDEVHDAGCPAGLRCREMGAVLVCAP